MAFTTLASEATLIASAVSDADAEVEVLGTSVLGTDITAITFGPNRASGQVDVLFAGCVHGVEPAGRETILDHLSTWLTTLPGFLSTLTVALIPTVNPDGFDAAERENDNGTDLNRDWVSLAEPETAAVATFLADRTPLLLVDMHEEVADGETWDIRFSAGSTDGMRNGSPDLFAMSTALRDQLIADAIAGGDDSGIYADGSFRSWRNMDVHAQLRHGTGLLVEGRRGPDVSPVAEATRIRVQEEAFDNTLTWVQSGTILADLAAAQAASQTDQRLWGVARRQYRLRSGAYPSPVPSAYRLTSAQQTALADWVAAFNVDTDGDLIHLAQEARAAIGPLVDPRSNDLIVAGTPVTTPFTLDYAQAQLSPPFDPTPDDFGLVNDATAQRRDGGEARVEVTGGPRGITAAGRYDRAETFDVLSDEQLPDIAGWWSFHGTWDEDRFPLIRINMRSLSTRTDGAALVEAVQQLVEGSHVRIANPPAWLPAEAIDQMILGMTETISTEEWLLDLHTTPLGPFRVGMWSEFAPEPDAPQRRDTAGSELASGIDDDDTSLSVATTQGPLWGVTGAANMHLPFDVRIGGEQVRVTAISGTSSPQTFTVTRSVNGVVKSHVAGAPVSLWRPAVRGR